MSVETLTWAWQQIAAAEGMRHSEALVLLRVANHANSSGEAFPGTETMSRYCGVSARRVRENLGRLQERGLLHRERRQQKKGRGRATDLLVLHMDQPDETAGRKTADQPDASDTSTGRSRHDQPDDRDSALYREPSVEPSEKGGPREDALRFCKWLSGQADEELRRSYPRDQVVAAAWLLDNADHGELRDAVAWAHTRPYWAPRVRTAGKLRRGWLDLRAEWRAANAGGGFARRAAGNGYPEAEEAMY